MASNEGRLRLALAIISGRKTELSSDDYSDLGYDVYKFGYYGTPTLAEVKEKAEDIVFDAIVAQRA